MKNIRRKIKKIKPKVKKALIIGVKESKIVAREVLKVLRKELPKIKREIKKELSPKKRKKKR